MISGARSILIEWRNRTRRRAGAWARLPVKAKAGVFILLFFALVAVIGPFVAPYDPSAISQVAQSLQPPSAAHWLGTTMSGQDVFSQLLVGIRLTMEVGIIVGIFATVMSVVVGVSAGYLGGIWDEVLSLLQNLNIGKS